MYLFTKAENQDAIKSMLVSEVNIPVLLGQGITENLVKNWSLEQKLIKIIIWG